MGRWALWLIAIAIGSVVTKHGITHTFELTEGRHEWTVWRHQLQEISPLLFR